MLHQLQLITAECAVHEEKNVKLIIEEKKIQIKPFYLFF